VAVDTVDYQILNRLLDELDIRAKSDLAKADDGAYWVCQRQYARYPFRMPCTVRFLPSGSFTVGELPGRTRNLSRSGLGLLVRRVFAVDDPVEVQVNMPDRGPMYLAGLVRFCRYAGRGYHELGLTLKAASPDPVFSGSPVLARRTYDWLNLDDDS